MTTPPLLSLTPIRKFRARAPLRLSLAGGGTDLPQYSDQYGGAVLNVTIDRFAHATLTIVDAPVFVAEASDLDVQDRSAAGPLDLGSGLALHRAVYNRMVQDHLGGRWPGIVLQTMVDAPPGSGLGSSSAAVVAMVEAFRCAFDLDLTPHDVARIAYRIERVDLGQQGGRQDQYAAAFGGINFIEFGRTGHADVTPLKLPAALHSELMASIVTCHTGTSRESHRIIADQTARITAAQPKAMAAMHQLKSDAYRMRAALMAHDLPGVADILDFSWQAKKSTSDRISTAEIEMLWDVAHRHGAIGGKVSGAGGGGFLMFLVDPADRARLMRGLNAAGGDADTVQFSDVGADSWMVDLRGFRAAPLTHAPVTALSGWTEAVSG